MIRARCTDQSTPSKRQQGNAHSPRRRFALVALLLILCRLAAPVRANEPDEVPLVGRPADLPFSEASAGFEVVQPGPEYRAPFTLETSASPVEVEELQPVTFTVTVRARGRLHHPPVRLDLRLLPVFSRSFHIEDVTDGKRDKIAASSWRWVYRLRPRTPGVAQVPGVPFVYYNPDLKPVEKAFQVLWSDPISLHVRPSEGNAPPVQAPESVRSFSGGPEVLRRQTRGRGPGVWLYIVLFGAPGVCLLWYLTWRHLYPDAARLARRRRSRAAQRALRALDLAARREGRPMAEQVTAAIASYLADRLGFARAEPTPDEVAAWLEAQGISGNLVESVRALLDRSSAARFGPEENRADLPGEARLWIISMEEASCPPSP